MTITDKQWADLIDQRATEPQRPLQILRTRQRRALLTDGRLFIVAADHTSRGMLGVGSDPFAMADRRVLLDALVTSLQHPEVDGVLGSADVLEDLALLGVLDNKLVFGTMNRGGIMGAAWELDDRMTAYDPASILANGLDGGKVLLRLAHDDAGTAPTVQACAQAVSEMAKLGLPIMVEPLPYHLAEPGKARLLDDDDALLRGVAIGAGLGSSSTSTWLKVPAGRDPARMLATTTLPALILGGSPGANPEDDFRAWERAMDVPNVPGLVVGRSLLFPASGNVASAIQRAARIVRPS